MRDSIGLSEGQMKTIWKVKKANKVYDGKMTKRKWRRWRGKIIQSRFVPRRQINDFRKIRYNATVAKGLVMVFLEPCYVK